jgi:flagellar motor switch protein FliM
MTQILSQDEVDALLQGLEGAETRVEVPSRSGDPVEEPQVYDFGHGELSVRGRLPGLEMVFSKFTRRLRNIFASELGKSVSVGFDSIDVVLYEDLIKYVPLPSSIHLVRLEPLRGLGIFAIEGRLAYTMIDIFFGGTGQRLVKVEGRDFTPIETNFLGKFVSKMLRGMEEAWQPVVQLTGRYLRSEVNPYLLGATAMGDVMVMTNCKVDLSRVIGEVLFAFPLAGIEELRDRLKSPFPLPEEDNAGMRTRLYAHLPSVEVSLQAVVGVVELSVRQLLRLRAGDVIQLSPQGMERMELWVEGKPRLRGRGAQSNGVKVFVVSEWCS